MNPIFPTIESLSVEFKSDRKRLSDAELVEAVVCLANAEGGELWLGVEDDGTPTDLNTDPLLLKALSEAGFVEAHGAARGRTYMLSAAVYGAVPDKAAYTRQAGFSPIQHGQMVLSYGRQHGRIKRAEAMGLCRLSEGQAKHLLKRMSAAGVIVLQGAGKGSVYALGPSQLG